MHPVDRIIQAHSHQPVGALDELLVCMKLTSDCVEVCTATADACLGEPNHNALVPCIRACLDAADASFAANRIITRLTLAEAEVQMSQLETCSLACLICAETCDRCADSHAFCGVCADFCRRTSEACEQLIEAVSGL